MAAQLSLFSVPPLTPNRITCLGPDEVFVFGSNLAGRHGKGAALLAKIRFGAKQWQGTGLMGRSYGIATKDEELIVLPLNSIARQVRTFIDFAAANPNLHFWVTEIGCGLAVYSPSEIAPMFAGLSLPNVSLPHRFIEQNEMTDAKW